MDSMSELRLYRHAITGIEGMYSDDFARVFGKNLVLVKAKTPVVEAVDAAPNTITKNDSSKEGNN